MMPITTARSLHVLRHASDEGWWELVTCDPDPRLGPHVVSCCGWTEYSTQATRRREVPAGFVPFIIDFGPSFRLASPRAPEDWQVHRHGFVAGVHDVYAVTESIGRSCGMQVNFTPLGGYLFFGVPMSTLVNRTVGLDDLFGGEAGRLTDRLQETPDWETRFAILDDYILRKLTKAPALTTEVSWAWRQLTRAAGQVDIGRLAADLGCSRKQLITRFREQIGVPPKTVARILRFERAVQLLRRPSMLTGVEVALDCGYFDQAHLIKDFKEFAGTTPSDFLKRQIPDLVAVLD